MTRYCVSRRSFERVWPRAARRGCADFQISIKNTITFIFLSLQSLLRNEQFSGLRSTWANRSKICTEWKHDLNTPLVLVTNHSIFIRIRSLTRCKLVRKLSRGYNRNELIARTDRPVGDTQRCSHGVGFASTFFPRVETADSSLFNISRMTR